MSFHAMCRKFSPETGIMPGTEQAFENCLVTWSMCPSAQGAVNSGSWIPSKLTRSLWLLRLESLMSYCGQAERQEAASEGRIWHYISLVDDNWMSRLVWSCLHLRKEWAGLSPASPERAEVSRPSLAVQLPWIPRKLRSPPLLPQVGDNDSPGLCISIFFPFW